MQFERRTEASARATECASSDPTKTSRLSNSFANNSIGCLPGFCFSNKIIGEATGGVKSAGVDAEQQKKGSSKGKETVGFVSFRLRRKVQLRPEATPKPESKFQIFLARFLQAPSTGPLAMGQPWER